MKISDLNLPAQVEVREFNDRDRLSEELAKRTQAQLIAEIDQTGSALLTLSGGSTPVPLFQKLSTLPLPWERVVVTLADDRWVPPSHEASNERLIQTHLLQNLASKAQFSGFWQTDMELIPTVEHAEQQWAQRPQAITSLILGMGDDGHTASLFPCAPELASLLSSEASCGYSHPTTAPHARITLTPKRLLNSRSRVLHICGVDKITTLATALSHGDPQQMPINLFLAQPLTIYWAP